MYLFGPGFSGPNWYHAPVTVEKSLKRDAGRKSAAEVVNEYRRGSSISKCIHNERISLRNEKNPGVKTSNEEYGSG